MIRPGHKTVTKPKQASTTLACKFVKVVVAGAGFEPATFGL